MYVCNPVTIALVDVSRMVLCKPLWIDFFVTYRNDVTRMRTKFHLHAWYR